MSINSSARPGLFTSDDIIQDDIGLAVISGGFGSIYKAKLVLPSGQVRVALKQLRSGLSDNRAKLSEDLLSETSVWLHLHHPNVLPFLGLYFKQNEICFVSPLLQNGSLPAYLKRNPLSDRIKFVLEVAAGLSYLHDKGVIHGDIKGSNILVTDDFSAQICDFGMSKFVDSVPGPSLDGNLGTLHWISPERLEGLEMARTRESDVYAFALTAYEILSDLLPFEGYTGSLLTFVRAVCVDNRRPPKEPTQSVDGLPYLSAWQIISRCWERNPGDRPTMSSAYQSMAEAYPAQHALVGRRIESWLERAQSQPKRQREDDAHDDGTVDLLQELSKRPRTGSNTVVDSPIDYIQKPLPSPDSMGRAVSAFSPFVTFIPPAPEILFGRDEEVETIVDRLCNAVDGRFTVLGPGGIGKTTIALAAAHHPRVIRKFGVRIVWIPCIEASTPELLEVLISQSVGVTRETPGRNAKENILIILRSAVSRDAPHLIIFDNFETPWDSQGGQTAVAEILQYMVSIQGISLLLTIRGIAAPAMGRVSWTKPPLPPISVLSQEAARRLYVEIHEEGSTDLSLDALLKEMSYMPLAVRLVATYGLTSEELPTDLLKQWKNRATSAILDQADDRLESVTFSVNLSIQSNAMKRNPDALALLKVLALLPGGARSDFVTEFGVVDSEKVPAALATLTKVALVQKHTRSNLVAMLSPVRSVVLESHPVSKDDLGKVTDAYFKQLAGHGSRPGDTAWPTDLTILRSEHFNVETILSQVLKDSPSADSIKATYNFAWYLYWTVPNADVLEQAVHIARSFDTVDGQRLFAQGSRLIGKMWAKLTRYDDSISACAEALAVFRAIEDERGTANSLYSLGIAYRRLGRSEETIVAAIEAQELYQRVGSTRGVGICLESLSDAYRRIGRYDEAIAAGESSVALHKEIGDELELADSLNTLGSAYMFTSQYDDAVRVVDEALEMYGKIHNDFGSANALRNLAEIYRKQNQFEKALGLARKALEIFTRIQSLDDASVIEGFIVAMEKRIAEESSEMDFQTESKPGVLD